MLLSLKSYIENPLERYNLSDCNGKPTPLPPRIKITKNGVPDSGQYVELAVHPPEFVTRYKSVVGALLYLASATFGVHRLARYSSSPQQCHWNLLFHVL